MAIVIGAFLIRKQGLTPQQFKDHYENVHIPLLLKLFGPLFPLNHRRHYPARDDNGSLSVIMGQPEDFDFDCYAEGEFESQEHFDKYYALYCEAEVHEEIAADEVKFIEQKKLRASFFDEVHVTKRPSA